MMLFCTTNFLVCAIRNLVLSEKFHLTKPPTAKIASVQPNQRADRKHDLTANLAHKLHQKSEDDHVSSKLKTANPQR